MLVSFALSNFRSFFEEETFSLVASTRLAGAHTEHAIAIPGSEERVLRSAVIYGANGAGKSNLFRALRYLRDAAINPRNKKKGTGREAFRFSSGHNATTDFDLQFIARDQLYRYGLKLDDSRVTEEWLVAVNGASEKAIYERRTDSDGAVKVEVNALKDNSKKLKALATVGGPENQTFLSTIRATLNAADIGNEISAVLDWFKNQLHLVAPDEDVAPIGGMLAHEADFLSFASAFLKASSTGVDYLKVEKKEISEEELRAFLPKKMAEQAIDRLSKEDAQRLLFTNEGAGFDLLLEKAEENHFYQITIQAAHEIDGSDAVHLDLTEESDGTQRLLNLLPALYQLRNENAVYVIDEIDRSLHPKLVYDFLEFFLKSCEQGHRQVLVTTHECNLLNLDLLRRDEIWFAEKDSKGATHLVALSDFKVRNDLDVRKHYLEGRFGGIPFLGDLRRLQDSTNSTS